MAKEFDWECPACGQPANSTAEIERLRAVIHEAEACLTMAVIPDGHERCKFALEKLRANQQKQND